MSGVKFELQKEVFESTKERLHGVVTVQKTNRKKKIPAYLCITGSIERPIRFTIYLVKKTEKGFKRKQEWTLSSLKESNYKSKESLEFDLQLEKSYHWLAQSVEEKDAFFALLHQICSRMHRPPKFLNFHIDEEDEATRNVNMAIVSVPKDTQMIESGDEEFGLTEREEFDLEKVLGRAENAVVNAEAFMEQLAKELSILDGENIHSIMDSEAQVNSLMDSIDKSISQLEEIENELVDYEDAVTHVKSAVEKIEEENSQMGTAAKNNQHLLSELTNLIRALDFPVGSQILNADFNSVEGIAKATKDAYALKEALNIEENIHPALLKMRSVADQKRRLEKFKQKFSQNLMSHLAKLFIHHGNISSIDSSSTVQALRLPIINLMYNELTPYTKLMGWLKVMDSEAYGSLLKTYTLSIQKIYEKNVRILFEEARTRISGSATTSGKLSGSTNDLRIRGRFFGKTRSLANREGDTESQGSGEGSVDSSERQHFYDILEQVLEGLEPSVNTEEKFIASFFCLEIGSSSSGNVSIVSPSKGSAGGELRRIMSSLFSAIETELNSFLTNYEKMEASFCMGAMVRLGNHALKAENTSTYIGMIFGSVLVQEKRSFDRLMNSYVQAINDSRLPRKAKPGILAFVTDFEDFAVMAESIFGNSARRSDLEKWYVKMLTAVFDGIMRLAGESGKTPGEVIRMENFHRLHSILSRLKVPALEQQKKDAKIKYNEALNGYVTKYFGRPLIKLNEFFEGVQAKVSQGVKESEIGYQMAFSRAELKRVIKEYPAKEVKKGLESLYRKVEKHLSEDENLLQVVWRAMQEEFIVQYKSIESLISRCYPGSKITLEFTIDDILLFFSEIAQSH
ncbi:unnamed protein product [Orchesella dallaii]|uniref:Exocyst complex component Sec3 PIP2-binding N-terminal domain-containing protein n=1 Tax=Orchesella dallaii TaxID=48710 RepID=A0ABP1Q0F7_9HEXA